MDDVEALVARAAKPTLERIRKLEEEASPALRPVLAEIRARVLEPGFTVKRLIRSTGVSKWVLTGFKVEIGLTPWQLVCEARMEIAARLLCDTDLSVEEIAYRTGYSSLSAFQKAFHRWCELKPSQFRDLARAVREELGELPEHLLTWQYWHHRSELDAAGIRELVAVIETLYGPTGRSC